MALVKCPDCGKMVSSRAEMCPECGCPAEYFLKEYEQVNEEQTIEKSDNTGKKYVDMKHIFEIQKISEDGQYIKALFMIDEEGDEKRVSCNEGLSVMDYCESANYVFYALLLEKSDDDSLVIKICRYDKAEGTSITIVPNIIVHFSQDEINADVKKGLFCSDKYLLYVSGGADYTIHRMDFDGKNDIIMDAIGIMVDKIFWIYCDCIWYARINKHSDYKSLYFYSFKDRKSHIIVDDFHAGWTDGKVVYVACSDKIIKVDIDGTSIKEFAKIMKDSSVQRIHRIFENEGHLYIIDTLFARQREVHEGQILNIAER